MTTLTVSTALALVDPDPEPLPVVEPGPRVIPVGATLGADLTRVDQPADRWALAVGRFLLGYDSLGTREAYARDLGQWNVFCGRLGADPLLAGRDHVAAWQQTLVAEGRARATLARKTACLAALYRYLVDEDVVSRSPVRGRRPRASDESTSTGVTEREAALLLDTATADGTRSAVLIGLLYLCGLRVSEALGARVEDLAWERGFRTIRVMRKGGKVGVVPLPTELAHQVDLLIGDWTTGTIIRTRSGLPLDRKEAWVTTKRLARKSGLPQADSLGPHSLRHGHATHALDANVPLRDVQDSLGHADPRTTRRYDRSRGRLDRHPGSVLAGRLALYRNDHETRADVTETGPDRPPV